MMSRVWRGLIPMCCCLDAPRNSALRSKTLASIGKLAAVHADTPDTPRFVDAFDSKLLLLSAAERVGMGLGVYSPVQIISSCMEAARREAAHSDATKYVGRLLLVVVWVWVWV